MSMEIINISEEDEDGYVNMEIEFTDYEEYEKIKEAAEIEGLSISDFIIKALKQHIRSKE